MRPDGASKTRLLTIDGNATVKSTAIPPPREYPTTLKPPGVHARGDDVIAIKISVL